VIATQRNRRLRDLIQPLPVRSPVRLGTKTAPYTAEFSVEPRKCAAETDWVAEEPVSSEPVSGPEFPVIQGKYREFRGSKLHFGRPQSEAARYINVLIDDPLTNGSGNFFRENRERNSVNRDR
jgi:hypothetical protein